jgi:hypothetical protein
MGELVAQGYEYAAEPSAAGRVLLDKDQPKKPN